MGLGAATLLLLFFLWQVSGFRGHWHGQPCERTKRASERLFSLALLE